MNKKRLHPQTIAVHEGVYKDETYNSITTPIYPTSIFEFDKPGEKPQFDYTRSGNPTRKALEENLTALEGGHQAWAVQSGMAAVTTVMMLLKSGDHLICGDEIYGGSWRLFHRVAPRMGIDVTGVNMQDPEAIRSAIRPETRMIWFETPTNPLLSLIDISMVVEIARDADLITAIDNTFMSPVLQSPFDDGVDIVMHSTTKYINGHSDVVGGAVIVREPDHAENIGFNVNAIGLGCSPFDAWLVLRGVKTLAPRMRTHCENAQQVAELLAAHPKVTRVYYPGLPAHPGHELAKRQMRGMGGMLSFELDEAQCKVEDFMERLGLFRIAVSLGGVESLVEQPWSMSHATMTDDAKLTAGITPGVLRLSVGIEYPDDLVADLEQALG
jgi:cystathionine gamma-synthase